MLGEQKCLNEAPWSGQRRRSFVLPHWWGAGVSRVPELHLHCSYIPWALLTLAQPFSFLFFWKFIAEGEISPLRGFDDLFLRDGHMHLYFVVLPPVQFFLAFPLFL